jgi:hypothetical protein
VASSQQVSSALLAKEKRAPAKPLPNGGAAGGEARIEAKTLGVNYAAATDTATATAATEFRHAVAVAHDQLSGRGWEVPTGNGMPCDGLA